MNRKYDRYWEHGKESNKMRTEQRRKRKEQDENRAEKRKKGTRGKL